MGDSDDKGEYQGQRVKDGVCAWRMGDVQWACGC